eukprot:768377-Hanusia_phi.AAC.3
MGGFLFGLDTSNISGALKFIEEEFHVTSALTTAIIVSGTIAGCVPATVAAGWLGSTFGRKPTMILSSVLFIIAACIMSLAVNITMLVGGRVVAGFAVGIASCTVPIYLAETAPTSHRGAIVTCYVVLITFGQAVAYMIAYVFAMILPESVEWRMMLGSSAIPAIFMLLGLIRMPETPRYLVLQNRDEDARKALITIRGHQNVEEELNEIKEVCLNEGQANSENLFGKGLRRHLRVGVGLQVMQQCLGINAIMYYSVKIIHDSGFTSGHDDIFYSIPIASTNFLFTFVGLFLIDLTGRRRLLLGSLLGATISLFGLAFYFSSMSHSSPRIYPPDKITNACQQYLNVINFCILLSKCIDMYCVQCYECSRDSQCGFCYSGQDAVCTLGNLDGPMNSTLCDVGSWSYDACPSSRAWVAIFLVDSYQLLLL